MNHEAAADLRDVLNAKRYVQGPNDDGGDVTFRLVRVQQPGYLNGDPMYEVLLSFIDTADSHHFPNDFLQLVTDQDCYLRVSDEEVHIRDWRA